MNDAISKAMISMKANEGFVGYQYDDHLGNPTIGYGTLLPLSRKEATVIARMRLEDKVDELHKREPFVKNLPTEARAVLYEMAYQLGVNGLLKFKRMIGNLQDWNFVDAAAEGRDSLWYKQTTNRAESLMQELESIKV